MLIFQISKIFALAKISGQITKKKGQMKQGWQNIVVKKTNKVANFIFCGIFQQLLFIISTCKLLVVSLFFVI